MIYPYPIYIKVFKIKSFYWNVVVHDNNSAETDWIDCKL